jgi:O-antigen/teichoic acid export membrane protein
MTTQNIRSSGTPQNLAASIGKNTLFGFISNFTQMGTRLITVPVVIHFLGLGGYGIWNIIMMSATYMRFGSVGVKTAFQKYVAEATGNGNYERANKLLSTGCALMMALSVAILIPVSLYSRSIARSGGVPPEFLQSAAGAIALLAAIMTMANVGAAYEAIIMGGHRIDLARKFGTVLTVAEAIAIVGVLHFGYGLFAMATVMGTSELIYIACCYLASHRVVPQIHIATRYLDKSVLWELFRFAGNYQLLNLMEVLYGSIVPFTILKVFGAILAGVYAVVTRITTSAVVLQDAFLTPILSGGTMVFASGSAERMQALVTKAFKVTLGLALFPLGFISLFGSTMAYAWTGQSDPSFPIAFSLVCAAFFFRAFSMLSFVLYRTSGNALMDNVLQVVRSLVLLSIVVFAHRLGYFGVLAGMAFTEFVGMVFMLFALTRTFHLFYAKSLLPNAIKLMTAAILILGAGVIAARIPLPGGLSGRLLATMKLGEACLGCLIVAWPVLVRTGSVTATEGRALFSAFLVKRQNPTPALAHTAAK